jgi:hypothetical protein
MNLKDTLSTICGIIFAICTALVTTGVSGVTLPTWLITASGILIAVSGAILGWLTGKNPNATAKTDTQVTNANSGK